MNWRGLAPALYCPDYQLVRSCTCVVLVEGLLGAVLCLPCSAWGMDWDWIFFFLVRCCTCIVPQSHLRRPLGLRPGGAAQIVSPERCCPRTARRCDSCLQVATVAVAPGLVPGVAWVEIQRGPLLGPARPLLVLPNDEFAEDVEVLIDGLVRRGASASQIDDFIVSLGCVLAADFHKSRALSKEEQDMLSKVRCLLAPV